MRFSRARLTRGLGTAAALIRRLGFTSVTGRTEQELREVRRQLESELAATQLLQEISAELIPAKDVDALYEKILDAAVALMRSDFASMQMLYPERGELRLLEQIPPDVDQAR